MEANSREELAKPGRGHSKVEHLGKSIDMMIYEFMEEHEIPGMCLAIVQAPYITRSAGYGLSNIRERRLASTNTIWAIGPISQAFCAVAIIQLYEQGTLKLTDSIVKYVSNLPKSWAEITIHALLQHATGIADYRLQKDYDPSKNYNPEMLLNTVQSIPLKFKPGTDVEQSATNFLLLAQLIENISKMSYHDFITQYQIRALGLKHTFFAEDFSNIKQEKVSENKNLHAEFLKNADYINPTENAKGYSSPLKEVPLNHSSALKGFGDLWASAADVSFWDIGLAGSLLIKRPENRTFIYKATELANGKKIPAVAGWEFRRHPGLMDIKGSVGGFSAFLSRFTDPADLLCVTLLANKENVHLANLARRIASAFGPNYRSNANDNEFFLYESVHSAPITVSRIEEELKQLKIPIFAKFDHAQNAKEVNLMLRPTTVIVFGSPAVGTHLMQENQSIASELPLKISIWEDEKGSVWIAFPRMKNLATKYGMPNNPIFPQLQRLLERLTKKGGDIY
jgi:CubicO group peptidase (beta-lactamase class C family)/uncharacterized protein (DUF302 family)